MRSSRSRDGEHSLRVLAILSMLMAFASISTDLYLSALPTVAAALHTGHGAVERAISGYLVGFSLGRLLWGPIGDRYGRRLPIAAGLMLFIIGSAGCALSTTAPMLIAWRAAQAVGACASVVVARAMVRNLYFGYRASQLMSTLMTVMAIAPLIGRCSGIGTCWFIRGERYSNSRVRLNLPVQAPRVVQIPAHARRSTRVPARLPAPSINESLSSLNRSASCAAC